MTAASGADTFGPTGGFHSGPATNSTNLPASGADREHGPWCNGYLVDGCACRGPLASGADQPTLRDQLEDWLPIPGGEGRYEASTLGRIRSLPRARVRGGILKPAADRKGYLFVTMRLDGDEKRKPYRVHKLVATTFHGPRPADKPLCRHLNDDRLDNRPENLAWGNMSENTIDTTENGINWWANRDACTNGHPYVEGSYRIAVYRSEFTVRPWRYCRVCDQVRNRKRRAEAHEAALRGSTGGAG